MSDQRQLSGAQSPVSRLPYPAFLFAIFFACSLTPLLPLGTAAASPAGFSDVARRSIPAVVSVRMIQRGQPRSTSDEEALLRRFFGLSPRGRQGLSRPDERRPTGQGSGFLISANGYILTNSHVVDGAAELEVQLQDGRKFEAQVVGSDNESEVAVLKIDGAGLPTLPIGDSEALDMGEWVIAVGNPFGLSATLTVGVVSAKGRGDMGIAEYEDFIQTDAAINPGNSGGPLLNSAGEVIGINTAIYSRSGGYMGIGFAVPIKMAVSIKDQLIKTGRVRRNQIGIYIERVEASEVNTLDDGAQVGIRVVELISGSPGSRAGLKSGDIITRLNGSPISSLSAFRSKVALSPLGASVKLTVYRNGRRKTLDFSLGSIEEDGEIYQGFGFELEASERRGGRGRRRFDNSLRQAFVIQSVRPGSPAARAGVEVGQRLLKVDGRRVLGEKLTYNLLYRALGRGQVTLLLEDQQGRRFVTLESENP
ncbi:MAG: trypsin-like peptidase domain-containing protein [Myxococcota bacterium]|nr:trypsin-like peptidase domain-containing protein [Myxococcota bacterium]